MPSARYAEHLTSLCALGAILHLGDSPNFTAACRNFTIEIFVSMWYNIGENEVHIMSESKLRSQSMDFAVQIINLVKALKEKRESIISNQIGRSGTSIGANIHEAQYAQGTKDFISNLKLHSKKQAKRDIGLSSYTGQNILMSRLSKLYLQNAPRSS